MKFLILALAFLLMTISVFPQTPFPLEAGVSQVMARWRATHYSDVRYKLNISLEKGAPLMKGEIEIRVKLTPEGAANDLILDWRTTSFASDNDKPYAKAVQVNTTIRGKSKESFVLEYADHEHFIVPKILLKTGENVIKIEFASPIKSSGAAVTRYIDREDGAEYVYSLFVPSDASTAFPVFDQPDLKARFQLNVLAPREWKVISNSKMEEFRVKAFLSDSRSYEEKQEIDQNKSWARFLETKPISTYVFAFAAGEFAEFEDEVEKNRLAVEGCIPGDPDDPYDKMVPYGRQVPKIYVRKSQAEKFKSHEKETFRLNREAVKYLETYFDFKFPFPKYDLVLIPEFPFGGMEHAGSTFLRESSVIFPSEPTANDFISRANVIFHEAAHQWFGDTVTMRWFDDLWLKEGFAEFMAYKTLEKVLPEYNAWKAFYERNKPLAYLTDSTKGTTPIYQEIPNLSAAKSAYGNIVYRKAPSFLRQAEFYLGEDKFQSAVRAFLKKHQYANAEWTDLVKEFEIAGWKVYLKDFANKWVKQRGVPVIKIKYEGNSFEMTNKGDTSRSLLRIIYKSLPDDEAFWLMDINLLIKYEGSAARKSDSSIEKLDLGIGVSYNPNHKIGNENAELLSTKEFIFKDSDIKFIFPNYQDYGYGIFLLDEKSQDYVLKNIQNEKDDFLRSMMWGTLWDSVREAELNPRDYVELAVRNISVEEDELTIQTILSRVSTAMNYYLPDAERDRLAPQLENLLIDKIKNAPTLGKRITFYRAFLNVAASENARAVLKQILSGDLGIGGGDTKMRAGTRTDSSGKIIRAANPAIPLRTKDRFDIVTRLLILGDAGAPQLLAELEKTETSDEAKRYAYAARAGIGTAENKARVWRDFTANKDISESWIEAAFAPFNSARHAPLTLPYLEKALAELPVLKRNRKIFFVNGWLGAFIGGQKSAEALGVVNKFLADNPNLDRDLRLKILENADGLERAVKIRAKYGRK